MQSSTAKAPESTGADAPKESGRPGLYALALLAATVLAIAVSVRADGIFACRAGGYGEDRYLSYCQATKYADYDHGAFWFDLEPSALDAARRADVVFLGNSRTQFGFSSDATHRWFAGAPARFYLLGFSHYENYTFEKPLLAKVAPAARAYIINIDSFFDQAETPPGALVMHDPGAEARYRQKRLWQFVHRPVCALLPAACRDEYTIFRSRGTGMWEVAGGRFRESGVEYDEAVDSAKVRAYVAAGRAFLPTLRVAPGCVLLTILPTRKTASGTAQAIAAGLELPFIAPQPQGLATFDGIHLDRPSAERWSVAFFEAAGPALQRCLATTPGAGAS